MEKEDAALATAKDSSPKTGVRTIWTEGSRQDNGRVGAAWAWKETNRWTSRRAHLGNNKEVYDAEVYAICMALKTFEEQQSPTTRKLTVFSDSQSAVDRIKSDTLGQGQAWAKASITVATRLASLGYKITVRWTPAHAGV